jgi:hypothetical protein
MDVIAGASALAGSLYPRRWLLLSGAVVPTLSHGLAVWTGSLAGMPVGWFDPPGSALLVIAFPCLAGFLCALLLHPDRGVLPCVRPRAVLVVAGGLALLALGPVSFIVWKLARSGYD